jgi:hypothetical protein
MFEEHTVSILRVKVSQVGKVAGYVEGRKKHSILCDSFIFPLHSVFYREDWNSKFSQIIGTSLPEYMASHPRRQYYRVVYWIGEEVTFFTHVQDVGSSNLSHDIWCPDWVSSCFPSVSAVKSEDGTSVVTSFQICSENLQFLNWTTIQCYMVQTLIASQNTLRRQKIIFLIKTLLSY